MVKDRFAKQLWISGGVILGSIAIAVGVLVFLAGEISAQASMITTDRQTIQEKTDAVSTLAQLEAAVPQAAQYQEAITQIIPDQFSLVTFPQWLSTLGARYNVTTDAVLQGSASPATAATAGTAQFSFTADGSPSNLTAFLNSMNATAPGFLLTVSSFDVVSDGANQKITGQGILFSR
ncbi:MAG TPA: hypothetical protein VIJ29_02440 [Candidatus Paceibacterota bacterium]